MRSLLLRITGRVQGVGYRAWAVAAATRLDLHGWVRNRADGSVEVLVSGPDDAVAAMIDACRTGPRLASVTNVAVSNAPDDGSEGFAPRPTL